jgi:pilus assembly protein TadC
MKPESLLLIALLILLLGAGGYFFLSLRARNRGFGRGDLRAAGQDLHYEIESGDGDEHGYESEIDAVAQAPKTKKRKEPTVEEKLFMAGRLSNAERRDFLQKRTLAPPVFGILGVIFGVYAGSADMLYLGGMIGAIAGFYIPMKLLEGWKKKQHEDISYFLPLVIEQIAIGVSSSLDIGPCLSQIVQMADERKSHNPVTELLKYAQFYVKSGVGLEEALTEIGRASGHAELKHVMMALAQVAKFGGEISKQLQDLADAVATQRESKIEARIRKLELQAMGPVALVFAAYMMLLFLGIGSEVMKVH